MDSGRRPRRCRPLGTGGRRPGRLAGPGRGDVVAGVGVEAGRLGGGWLVGAGRALGLGGGSGGAQAVWAVEWPASASMQASSGRLREGW